MSGVVKGYIVKAKGWDVNWARATASSAKEKAHRVQVEKMKISFNLEVSKLNAGDMSCKIKSDVVCKDFVVKVGVTSKASCPYKVPLGDITMVHNLLCFLNDLSKSLERKVGILEGNVKNCQRSSLGCGITWTTAKLLQLKPKTTLNLLSLR
jgi:hypothetical protein